MENHVGKISTGEILLIRPPKLSDNQHSHLAANQEEPGEGNYEFNLRRIFVHTLK
jgi:hypothetical protein